MRALIAALVLAGCADIPAVAPGEDCLIVMIDEKGGRTCHADEGAPLPNEVK